MTIDTNMTDEYLRAVQQEMKKAEDIINFLNEEVVKLNAECAILNCLLKKYEDNYIEWKPIEIVPQDEDRIYLVKKEGGQPLFSRPINGKWLTFVSKWMHIPD